jgi:hypothetical protein
VVLEEIDRDAIRAGALVATVIAAPAGAAQLLLDSRYGAEASAPLGLVILLAFAAGGYQAGKRSKARPLTDGALGAMLAFAVVQAVFLVLGALGAGDDQSVHPAAIVFSAMLATSCGIVGGQVGATRRRQADRRTSPDEVEE